ncbi:hypothetical protein Q9L58_010462 [Maublancomyces gigas]|uniref:Uncharacterized protein n=1 Tax=Discina gigas TaxID=1032678 RepID=A0ABR3G414_9PEZI
MALPWKTATLIPGTPVRNTAFMNYDGSYSSSSSNHYLNNPESSTTPVAPGTPRQPRYARADNVGMILNDVGSPREFSLEPGEQPFTTIHTIRHPDGTSLRHPDGAFAIHPNNTRATQRDRNYSFYMEKGGFVGPADEKPSPKTQTRNRGHRSSNITNPDHPSGEAPDSDDSSYDPARRIDELTRQFLQERERDEEQQHGDWAGDKDDLIRSPSTQPNKAPVHFEDIEATPRPLPTAFEVPNHSKMSEGGESDLDLDPMALLLKTILKDVMTLEKQ